MNPRRLKDLFGKGSLALAFNCSYALAVGGGEDYELLFTAPADIEGLVDFPVYQIGEILPGDSLIWRCNGQTLDFDVMGFSHF